MRRVYVKLFFKSDDRRRVKPIRKMSRPVSVRGVKAQARLWRSIRIAVATFEAEEAVDGIEK